MMMCPIASINVGAAVPNKNIAIWRVSLRSKSASSDLGCGIFCGCESERNCWPAPRKISVEAVSIKLMSFWFSSFSPSSPLKTLHQMRCRFAQVSPPALLKFDISSQQPLCSAFEIIGVIGLGCSRRCINHFALLPCRLTDLLCWVFEDDLGATFYHSAKPIALMVVAVLSCFRPVTHQPPDRHW